MRAVSGFERPLVQWLFVALGVVLIVVVGAEAVGLRRARGQIESLRAGDLNARLEREQLERRAAREQAAREALSLELGRVRGGAAPPATQPTLTLSPLAKRGAQPPDATVAQPAPSQAIQLRLEVPGHALRGGNYAVAIRSWSTGQTIWTRSGLAASTVDGKAMVTAFITGDVLVAGAYELALTWTGGDAGADVASYEVAIRPPDR